MIKGIASDLLVEQLTAALATFEASSTDDGRTITFRIAAGDTRVERSVTTAVVLDRGVWREGAFKRGDAVTWGGSLFVAQRDTETKPETMGSDWRLAVKRGRDGKQGPEGKEGPRGPKGDKGDPR